MNIENLKLDLNQYFNYIKTVFLRDYSKYLEEEKIKQIENLNDVFKIDLESKFKIYLSDKINICLNIEDFINDNRLNNDADLKDISIDGRIYVKFLIDNKNDPERLLLSIILKPIITFFVGKNMDIINNGVIDMICNDFVNKYNITYKMPYESKELEIINLLKNIVGETVIFKTVLNNNISLLENSYDLVAFESNEEFIDIYKDLNNEYQIFAKRIGKVYYSDTLYDYQNINYKKEKDILNKIIKNKYKKDDTKKERLLSIKKCIENLKKHLILFDNNERLQLDNAEVEINNFINQIDTSEDIAKNSYERALNIENKLMPLTEKVWIKQLTHPLTYKEGLQFCFLIGNSESLPITEAKLITNNHLKNVNNKLKYNYGYIYKINNNIIYSSSKDILVQVNNETNSDNIITYNGINIEIDNQKDSKLLTPEVLMRENIKNKDNGKVLLFNPTIIGIFVVYDNEFSTDYKKAVELSENMELPIVKINRNLYQLKEQIKETKPLPKIKHKNHIEKKIRISDKIKLFKNNILYETEELEEFKKSI